MIALVVYNEFNTVVTVHVFSKQELAVAYVNDRERMAYEDAVNDGEDSNLERKVPEGEPFAEPDWDTNDRTVKDMTYSGLSYELFWDSRLNPTADRAHD